MSWKNVMKKWIVAAGLVITVLSVQNHVSADAAKEIDLTDGLPTTAFSASSIWTRPGDSRNFGPEKAFDNVWDENNGGFSTNSATNQWIAVDFGEKQSVSKMRYKADLSYNYVYDMKDFVVQGSNDNKNWENQFNGSALGNNTIQEFSWHPTGSFRYWRLQLLNSIGNKEFIMIAEMELIGVKQTAPLNLVATGKDASVLLTWSSVTDASGYSIKRSTQAGGPYTTIATGVKDVTYNDNDVVNGTTYYYVVSALYNNGESSNSNEASATPQKVTLPSSGDRAILTITMTSGLEKEFDLSIEEINAFLDWYDAKDAGTGAAKFAINKHHNNKGPFSSRKDYVIFDKILTFSVDEYNSKE